ncbi:TPA: DUF2169 family type VI secretion system accessory protein [Pseudomonas aeruginosa]|uniref:DUF2169 family type VI secretion system accessory protein n=1 Tax=Pseudomonas aeruginosa TaxID=287 RepID=UPI000464A1FD|nr:DUF2169 domain-containing protein [Pseudomonas aeruginosa]MBU8393111.1 DUF2169 domain-containing protein [Pseudomonas aeruginosa]MCV4131378.1 DUF2169 domain-containing protein [Pseudomonas aeruginosa]MCV4189258.1 DUF2169 domain-containing protein [Pseudomonas aeruginosa]WBI96181.1 hypothetical protein PALA52_00099 [Pseudomonas aeruginosa]WCX95379.1 DUF2169 domain-containing protein [Pseudomonas aeruginosa]
MELLNATPLAAAYNQGLDVEGRESLVVIAKGSFDLPLDGREARLLEEQQALLMVDEFYGEPGLSAPRRECEFVPFKPFCDVLVLGSAQAPGGRPVQQLTAGIRVGRVSKALTVHGPRQWEPGLLGAGAGVAQPFQRQDISYASAFGGSHASPDNPGFMDCYMANPAGRGWFPRSADTAEIVGTPMPATEKLGEPVDSPHGRFTPMALGPLGRHWQARVGFAGRYDDAWLADRFPFLPADFDERYFQSAPADQWTDHLRGGEEVLLLNLTGEERAAFRVPRREVPVTFFLKKGGHETAQARIDTLLVDCDARRVEVTWRIRRPLKRNLFEIAQVLVGSKSAAWWRARELGKDYYPSLAALARSRQTEEDDA